MVRQRPFSLPSSAIAMYLRIVISYTLFIRWRDPGPMTIAVSAATDHVPEKNSERGVGKALTETMIGKTRKKSVMPIKISALADKNDSST